MKYLPLSYLLRLFKAGFCGEGCVLCMWRAETGAQGWRIPPLDGNVWRPFGGISSLFSPILCDFCLFLYYSSLFTAFLPCNRMGFLAGQNLPKYGGAREVFDASLCCATPPGMAAFSGNRPRQCPRLLLFLRPLSLSQDRRIGAFC